MYVVCPDGAEGGEYLGEGGDDEVLGVDLAGDGGGAGDGARGVDLVLGLGAVQEGLPPLSAWCLLHGGARLEDEAAAAGSADAKDAGRSSGAGAGGTLAQAVRGVVNIEAV